jgi:putative addiction module component (TIGR02574 family)
MELFDRLDGLFGQSGSPLELSDEMKALLDERDAEYEANPGEVYTWEKVMEHLKRKK